MARLGQLRTLIEHHRYVTHVLDQQEISEAALDSLKHELGEIEGWYPELITPDSPSQRVAGQPLPQFKKVQHTARMFSLVDVFSRSELEDWDARWRKLAPRQEPGYVVDLKLDGLALSLRYEHGVFVQAATRGDGYTGEDVTHTARTIESVPLRLRLDDLPASVRRQVATGAVEIRGEAVMLKRDFEALNRRQSAAGEPTFANPRNVSAGTIRQLDPSIAAKRKLTFFAWELVTDLGQTKISEAYDWLKLMGISINPNVRRCTSLAEVEATHERVSRDRESLPFWIDGMVVKLDDLNLYRQLGFVGKTPRAAVAWKYSAEQVTTTVEDIVVQVGRTGAMTPVAHLRPVQVAGTTVSRATLHNADEIARLDVRVGDTVIIQKAGDIIPEVVQVLNDLRPKKSTTWRMVRRCPVCAWEVKRAVGEAIHFCPNPNCPAKKREALYHFVSRPAFDIVGLGPNTIDVLIDEDLVHQPADLFSITADQLVGLPLFAEKKAENLVAAIKDRRTISLDRFLYALGIRHVGTETARTLAQKFRTVEAVITADLESLAGVTDIGVVVAKSIAGYFANKKNRAAVEKLRSLLTITPARAISGGPLAGGSFVVTGTLSSLSREAAEDAIRAAGGRPTSSVSAKTTAVIVGEEPGSKAAKARTLGVPVWDETAFLKKLGR